MWNTENNLKLRERLREITENEKNHGNNIGIQLNLIKDLSNEIPHSIKLVEEAIVGDDNSWGYNCFIYAFDLRNKTAETKYITQDIFPNPKFTRHLVDNFLTEISLNNAENDNYIVYFENSHPKHAGKVNNYKIVSKWGTAHRWSHALFEVPSDYGDEIKFFKKMSENDIYEIFKKWAESELIFKMNS